MKRREIHYNKWRPALLSLCLLACLLLALPQAALAEGTTPATGGFTPPVFQYGSLEDVFSVSLPTVYDGMLDFIVDPQSLVSRTGATRYGGVPVENGATLLFSHPDGSFSSRSEALSVTNYGACPVAVTVWVSVETASGVVLTEDKSFSGDLRPSVYLALVDSEGQEYPAGADPYVYHTVVLPVGAGAYSFGLRGASNPEGKWAAVSTEPMRVQVSWEVEPILPQLFQTVPAEPAPAEPVPADGPRAEATPGSLTLLPTAPDTAAPDVSAPSASGSDGSWIG